MNLNDEELLAKQLEREEASAKAGYNKFQKSEDKNKQINNASSNIFGLATIKSRHEDVIEVIEQTILKVINQSSGVGHVKIKDAINRCTALGSDGKAHELMQIEVWAFLGLQATIDNIFNPNREGAKTIGRFGGDKNLVAKKTQSELELFVGKLINDHMSLLLIKETFPNWFRVADKFAKRRSEGGMRSTPAYWSKRMVRSINKLAKKIEDNGDPIGAEFLRKRKPWTTDECRTIGELVVGAVIRSNADTMASEWSYVGNKKVYHVVLTLKGKQNQAALFEAVAAYSHEVLPMMIEPNIITNESLGGWFKDQLQEPENSHKGEMILSDKHLEFINRQARVQFQINPFTYQLLHRLKDEEKPLGKFDYQVPHTIDVGTNLGVAGVDNPELRQQQIDRLDKEEKRQARHETTSQKEKAFQQSMHNVISLKLVEMVDKLADDEWFYIPMKFDFRGRIYSRVPFLSFQGTDAGKHLLRFTKKTPIDNRTEHWLKIGIANAAGCDKQCWDERLKWFEKNKDQIINVGKMFSGGDFTSAYAFLRSDDVEDPFCLAALANEWVKIFIDEVQDYTQVFVLVDASASGTSIFNAWRLNKHGAEKTNLIDTNKPADIYMEVWEEIKRIAPPKAFRASFIKQLEKSKLLRKMMKTTYVPASYASPPGEQLVKLKSFNEEKLVPKGIGFKTTKGKNELKILQELWPVALENVSFINSIVSWFKSRTKEALKQGAKDIRVTNSVGSQMILRYPKSDMIRVPVLGNADVTSRRKALRKNKDEPFPRKLLSAVTANVTHMTDASALCEALWDFDVPWVGVHDAVGLPPGEVLDEGIERLKRGLINATRHNIWDTFRSDNNLPLSPVTAGPVIGDLDLEDVMNSNYMFS